MLLTIIDAIARKNGCEILKFMWALRMSKFGSRNVDSSSLKCRNLPSVINRHYSFWLTLVSIDEFVFVWTVRPFLGRYRLWFLFGDNLKRRNISSRWNLKVTRDIWKSSSRRWRKFYLSSFALWKCIFSHRKTDRTNLHSQ